MENKEAPPAIRPLTPEERDRIVSEGERIFREKVSDEEKRQHHGGYVAIDILEGRYAFGPTFDEADEGLAPLPEGHLVYIKRIGLAFRIHRTPRI